MQMRNIAIFARLHYTPEVKYIYNKLLRLPQTKCLAPITRTFHVNLIRS